MPGRPPSLRAISAFEAAARHQSFSKAAIELNLTHGAVSHAIKGLEQRLGSALFDRRGRGVSLTEAGRVLAGRVRLGIGLLSEAFETRPWLERSRLVVSTLPSFATAFLIPRLRHFRECFPNIELEVRASWNLAKIGVAEADIGLRYGPGGWAGLNAAKLADEFLFPVVSPLYPRQSPREPAEIVEHDLIGHPEFPWRQWLDAAGVSGPEPKYTSSFDDSMHALEAAVTGVGIALGRSLLARQWLRSRQLVRLFDVEVRSDYAYWIVWSPVSPKLATIAAFRDWIIAEFSAELPGGA